MGCYCSGPDKVSTDTTVEFPPTILSILQQQITENPVLLYSSLQSVESQAIKDLLRSHSILFEYFEIEHMSSGHAGEPNQIKAALRTATRRSQLPILFIGGKCIGGYQELQEYAQSGKLFQLLRETRISFVRASAGGEKW